MEQTVKKPRKSAKPAEPAHKPMRGRPTAAQVTSIERAIVEAARAMFLADGFDAVGMKQVAERAQVSKGTLYARYPSKEALFVAVIEASVRQWSEEAARDDNLLTNNIEQRLRHHAATIATWLDRPDVLALQRLVLAIEDRFPALTRTMRQIGYGYIIDLIVQDLEEVATLKGANLRDARSVARLLVGSITGVHIQEGARAPGDRSLHDFGQRVVDVIMAGKAGW